MRRRDIQSFTLKLNDVKEYESFRNERNKQKLEAKTAATELETNDPDKSCDSDGSSSKMTPLFPISNLGVSKPVKERIGIQPSSNTGGGGGGN